MGVTAPGFVCLKEGPEKAMIRLSTEKQKGFPLCDQAEWENVQTKNCQSLAVMQSSDSIYWETLKKLET